MFSQNLVMAVKVGGKVLREFDGTVALPFGSEYTILLKNLSTQRASVKVSIDGQDATEGVNLIINAGESMELKRSIKNGNLDTGNAFKFIEKTAQIEAYRGNKAEDGLLTVTYEFERAKPKPSRPDYPIYPDYPKYPWNGDIIYTTNKSYLGGNMRSVGDSVPEASYNTSVNDGAMTLNTYSNNVSGITAPGSIVEQKFNTTFSFIGDGYKNTMTIKMIGEIKGQALVKEAITVKKLQRCQMCGTSTKQTAKFCHECGASVQIV